MTIIGLDRWLTTPPDDGFDNWAEEVIAHKIPNAFYYQHEAWFEENSGQCNKWLNKLFDRGKDASSAALIIERTFKLYKL